MPPDDHLPIADPLPRVPQLNFKNLTNEVTSNILLSLGETTHYTSVASEQCGDLPSRDVPCKTRGAMPPNKFLTESA